MERTIDNRAGASRSNRLRRLYYLERHANGPRVYVLGKRIHEFQVGFVLLVMAAVTATLPTDPVWLATGLEGASGLWLVIKDWPDLFPSTRDTACWRVGVHRPPVMPWNTTARRQRKLRGTERRSLSGA